MPAHALELRGGESIIDGFAGALARAGCAASCSLLVGSQRDHCVRSGCAFCVCGSAGQQDVSRRGEAARPRQASSLAAERCPFVRLRRRSALQALRLQAALPPRRTHDARTTTPRCRRAVLTTAAQLRCNGGSESVQNLRFREGREARQAAARNGQAARCGECGGLTVQRKLPFRAETSMHGGGCR